MNSIEVTTSPEVTSAAPKNTQKEAAPLRLFYKEKQDAGYTLHQEGPDFQRLMKEAVKLQEKGRDILLNERDNPNIVHAKSNRENDVTVGRVIEPAKAQDGTYKRGAGDVVLASFFEKLPLDTKAFEAPQPAVQEPAKPTTSLDKTPSEVTAPEQPAAQKNAAKAQETGEKSTGESKGSKPILSKTGYELPEGVLKAYQFHEGKFKEHGSDAVRFEDHGKKLSTKIEDPQVIRHMIEVTIAKNWGTLELKGTDTFRQIAWLEATANGRETTGYKPNERDLEQLEQLKRERGQNTNQPAMTGTADKAKENSVEVVASRERSTPAPEAAKSAAPESQSDRKDPTPATSATATVAAKVDAKASPEAVSVNQSASARIETGRLIEHGAAKYNFDPKEKDSYYVKLETDKGEKVVWGKDLQRAMGEANTKPGETVSLTLKGAKDVEVEANVRDEKGNITGKQTIEAQRNKWEVNAADLGITRTLSKDEQLRVDAALKVLGKTIAKYPEKERANVLAKVGDAINKGEINLPSPKVTVRSPVEKPTPSPSRDMAKEQVRSR